MNHNNLYPLYLSAFLEALLGEVLIYFIVFTLSVSRHVHVQTSPFVFCHIINQTRIRQGTALDTIFVDWPIQEWCGWTTHCFPSCCPPGFLC